MSARTRGALLVVSGVLLLALVVLLVSAADRRTQVWDEGETHGAWTVRYNGHSPVRGNAREVVLEPASAASLDQTHGALVHTVPHDRDVSFALTLNTEEQVRQDEPNTWEVGWVLWSFTDDDHFYAVALKPNGWELSKQDPAYPGKQRFLASGDERLFPIGTDYRVEVRQRGAELAVTVDGQELVRYTDRERPYLQGGAIALYTEDARVRFTDFDLPPAGD